MMSFEENRDEFRLAYEEFMMVARDCASYLDPKDAAFPLQMLMKIDEEGPSDGWKSFSIDDPSTSHPFRMYMGGEAFTATEFTEVKKFFKYAMKTTLVLPGEKVARPIVEKFYDSENDRSLTRFSVILADEISKHIIEVVEVETPRGTSGDVYRREEVVALKVNETLRELSERGDYRAGYLRDSRFGLAADSLRELLRVYKVADELRNSIVNEYGPVHGSTPSSPTVKVSTSSPKRLNEVVVLKEYTYFRNVMKLVMVLCLKSFSKISQEGMRVLDAKV